MESLILVVLLCLLFLFSVGLVSFLLGFILIFAVIQNVVTLYINIVILNS